MLARICGIDGGRKSAPIDQVVASCGFRSGLPPGTDIEGRRVSTAGLASALRLLALVVRPTLTRVSTAPPMSAIDGALNEVPQLPRRLSPNRKSTRLNSSHVKISYAVFCLKKKKTKQE